MTIRDEMRLLRRVPMFAKVDAARLKLICFTSDRIVFDRGEILFQQGDSGDAAYLILSGNAEVEVETRTGPLHVADVGPNKIVGEISVLCGVPRTATVRATSELVTLRLDQEQFMCLVEDYPEVAVAILRELAARLDAALNKAGRIPLAP
jgi:CRP-like cAMP-binding protein